MNEARVPEQRLTHFDGLRGWASLLVLLFHSTWEMFGARVSVLRSPWFGFVFARGGFAVEVFFVLSGLVLTAANRRGAGRRSLLRMALRRYPRLAMPVLAASLVAWALMSTGLLANHAAGVLLHNSGWLGAFLSQRPNLGAAISFSLVHVFRADPPPGSYGPFLWTMSLELEGSLLVLLLAALAPPSHVLRFPIYAVSLVLVRRIDPYLGFFVVGLALADLQVRWPAPRARGRLYADVVGLALAVAGLAFAVGGPPHWPGLRAYATATIVVMAPLLSPSLRCWLSAGPSHWLGRVSFPLYLLQAQVMCSLGCWLAVALTGAGWTLVPVAIVTIPATIAVSLLAAAVFEPVERLAILVSRRFSNAIEPLLSGLVTS